MNLNPDAVKGRRGGNGKPTAVLKALNVYDEKKHGHRIDDQLPMIPQGEQLEPPARITSEEIKKRWGLLTDQLILWGVLSYADIPDLENAFLILQETERQIAVLRKLEVTDKEYKVLFGSYLKGVRTFHDILLKYGISPIQRTRLALDISQTKLAQGVLEKLKDKQSKKRRRSA